MKNEFKDKTILVTGGTGTIGSELVKEILKYDPLQVRILSRDENKQYYLQEELNYPSNVRFLIGDIRDRERLDLAFQGVDIVFHAAAMKHVPFCEYNPFEAVKTNIYGSQNVIDAALKNKVKKVIAISTDKAVDPANIMGTSKLMMEKLIVNANYYKGKSETNLCCVRFGNIAWSNGSVLPLWKKQAEMDHEIRVTKGEMTRFFMSKSQAMQLIMQATTLSRGGEIFILKMPAIKLDNLAKIFIDKYFPKQKINIKVVGSRAGEKIHELLFDEEINYEHVFENDKMYIIIPQFSIYAGLKANDLGRELKDYPNFFQADEIRSISSDDNINEKGVESII
ncbi:MAG: SDR family NAD(P)-dependent oxidoreductase [Candidatus Buchananbacteria bacterium]